MAIVDIDLIPIGSASLPKGVLYDNGKGADKWTTYPTKYWDEHTQPSTINPTNISLNPYATCITSDRIDLSKYKSINAIINGNTYSWDITSYNDIYSIAYINNSGYRIMVAVSESTSGNCGNGSKGGQVLLTLSGYSNVFTLTKIWLE